MVTTKKLISKRWKNTSLRRIYLRLEHDGDWRKRSPVVQDHPNVLLCKLITPIWQKFTLLRCSASALNAITLDKHRTIRKVDQAKTLFQSFDTASSGLIRAQAMSHSDGRLALTWMSCRYCLPRHSRGWLQRQVQHMKLGKGKSESNCSDDRSWKHEKVPACWPWLFGRLRHWGSFEKKQVWTWCRLWSICRGFEKCEWKKKEHRKTWVVNVADEQAQTNYQWMSPPPAMKQSVRRAAVNSTNSALSFGPSWALSSSRAWRGSSVLAMLSRQVKFSTSGSFGHSKYWVVWDHLECIFDKPAGNLKIQMVSSPTSFFVFSWHAEVTGMQAECMTRGS